MPIKFSNLFANVPSRVIINQPENHEVVVLLSNPLSDCCVRSVCDNISVSARRQGVTARLPIKVVPVAGDQWPADTCPGRGPPYLCTCTQHSAVFRPTLLTFRDTAFVLHHLMTRRLCTQSVVLGDCEHSEDHHHDNTFSKTFNQDFVNR